MDGDISCAVDHDRWRIERYRRLAEVFHLSARYEWAFWEMSWRMERWPV